MASLPRRLAPRSRRLQHAEAREIAPEPGRVDESLRGQAAGACGNDVLGHVVEINHRRSRSAQAERVLENLPRRFGLTDFVGKHHAPELSEEAEAAAYVLEMQRIGV